MAQDRLSMDPQEVREVARGIERIADDLRGAQQRFTDHAQPPATGRDEVSITVARTTAELGQAQRRLGEQAERDLRALSDAVALHATTVQRQDAELAATTVRLEL